MRTALVHDWLTGFRGGERCLTPMRYAWDQAGTYWDESRFPFAAAGRERPSRS